jgi:hypothetical protein
MGSSKKLLLLLPLIIFLFAAPAFSQLDDEERVDYFQMEPLDDSLFIKIQTEILIDPPDPKAEIIVDLRDPNNQTVSIKGTLYPFLAFTPETRARIATYPFKLNLEEQVNYTTIFTQVFDKVKFSKILEPPTLFQISSTLQYINPFMQFFGGERFGISIKKDIGISFGVGTPYSGPLETNFVEANFHILGLKAGFFTKVDAITELKQTNNHNNLYATGGIHLSYVFPLGNFLELGFLNVTEQPGEKLLAKYRQFDTGEYKAYILDDIYFNWEFRYPLRFLGSTRAKFYIAQFVDELHFGFTGRELSIAGNVFDLRFDAMTTKKHRQPQYVLDVLVQQIFESWAFSSLAIGPSAILSKTETGGFGFTSIFLNIRFKVGASL